MGVKAGSKDGLITERRREDLFARRPSLFDLEGGGEKNESVPSSSSATLNSTSSSSSAKRSSSSSSAPCSKRVDLLELEEVVARIEETGGQGKAARKTKLRDVADAVWVQRVNRSMCLILRIIGQVSRHGYVSINLRTSSWYTLVNTTNH